MTGRPTDIGTYYGTLSVCDRYEVCLDKALTIIVQPINGVPILKNTIADVYVYTKSHFVFKIPEGTFEDISGGAMFFTARQPST
jgi:hypothetical protein